MDLYCPKCREPWDNDSLHDLASELGHECDGIRHDSPCADGCVKYRELAARFRVEGCTIFPWASHNEDTMHYGDPLVAAVYDLMGDDMDGAAAAFDDAEYMGLL